MLGLLTAGQIDSLLINGSLGRIGYYDGEKCYITPVTYFYDGIFIYGQTNEGMKLDNMRKNRHVCFEVDVYRGISNWESVIAWGNFEELSGETAVEARKFFYNKILHLLTEDNVSMMEDSKINRASADINRMKEFMYRIKLSEKIGHYETR